MKPDSTSSSPVKTDRRARLVQGVALVALALSVITARSLLSARAEWQAGQRSLQAGQASLAITHFRRSAGWQVPFSPYTARSLQMLDHLAKREAARDRDEAARLATLSRTAAIHSARSAWTRLPSDPSPFFSALALVSWLAWSLASLLLVTRGLDSESQLTPHAPRLLLALVAGMGLFALGLALA